MLTSLLLAIKYSFVKYPIVILVYLISGRSAYIAIPLYVLCLLASIALTDVGICELIFVEVPVLALVSNLRAGSAGFSSIWAEFAMLPEIEVALAPFWDRVVYTSIVPAWQLVQLELLQPCPTVCVNRFSAILILIVNVLNVLALEFWKIPESVVLFASTDTTEQSEVLAVALPSRTVIPLYSQPRMLVWFKTPVLKVNS